MGKKWGYLQKNRFSVMRKTDIGGGFSEHIEILLIFWILMKKNGEVTRKRFYGEMWRWGLVKTLWDPPRETVLWQIDYIWGNIWRMPECLIGFVTKLQ